MPLDAQALIVEDGSGLALPVPPIVALLNTSRPAAIARLVVAVIIRVAINRVSSRRDRSHIGEEIGKGVHPAIANGNTPSAVVLPMAMTGIGAALFHASPSIVFRRSLGPPRPISVNRVQGDRFFNLETAATLDSSAVKMITSDFTNVAALAAAKPPSPATCIRRSLFNNRQSAKAHADRVCSSIHWKNCKENRTGGQE